eukprot:3911244-Prymnesium_polylepis.1
MEGAREGYRGGAEAPVLRVHRGPAPRMGARGELDRGRRQERGARYAPGRVERERRRRVVPGTVRDGEGSMGS